MSRELFNPRSVTFTCRAIFAFLICISFGCDKKTFSNTSPGKSNASNQSRDDEVAKYKKMFGSIKVPKWPELNEPEAPHPIIYLVVNKDIDDVLMRKIVSGLQSWEYEEMEATKARDLSRTSNSPVSFVVVADRDVPMSRLIPLLEKTRKQLEIQDVWLQVWGLHPYPLQIPINVDLIKTDTVENNIDNLQQYVNWHSTQVKK